MLDSYIILNKKNNNIIKIYYYSLIGLLTLLIYLILNINYSFYINCKGIIIKNNDKYLIKIILPLNKINVITSNNIFIIERKKYNYQVKNIRIDNKKANILLSTKNIDNRYSKNKLNIIIKEENYTLLNYIKNKGGIK